MCFADLPFWSRFVYNGGIYTKMQGELELLFGQRANAVQLDTGGPAWFADSVEVQKI